MLFRSLNLKNPTTSKNVNNKSQETISDEILRFEIKLANFIVQNHLSFATGERMLKFIKENCNDYDIIKKASLSDDKLSKLIRDCIKPLLVDNLNKKLENILFSISFDETTHKQSKKKYFGIVAQFYDEKTCNLQSYLHAFKENSDKTDSEAMYKILCNEIFDNKIGQNVIGLSMDNASVNKGKEKSISTSILQKYPYIWCNFCLCHSCNLISKFEIGRAHV